MTTAALIELLATRAEAEPSVSLRRALPTFRHIASPALAAGTHPSQYHIDPTAGREALATVRTCLRRFGRTICVDSEPTSLAWKNPPHL
jgi:hypothetical protein